MIHDSWGKNWARDRHLSVVSLCSVVEAMAVGEIIYERVPNNIIIHFTSICWVPHVPAPCLLWHTPKHRCTPCFHGASRPKVSLTVTHTNEWTFTTSGGKYSDRKKEVLWEERVQKSSAQTWRNSFVIQGLIVEAASRPIGPYPASPPEALLLGWPRPPLLPALFSGFFFPSWALFFDGAFYFQLHVFFYHPPPAQNAASPFKHVAFHMNTLEVPAPPSRCVWWNRSNQEPPWHGPFVAHFQIIVTPCILAEFMCFFLSSTFFYANIIASWCFLCAVKSWVSAGPCP